VNITLNGEKRKAPDCVTVRGLLEFLDISPQRVAVELNETLVKKDLYGATQVSEGDAVEVVSFMGGGGQAARNAALQEDI